MAEIPFLQEVAAQPAVLAEVARAYRHELATTLDEAAAILRGHPSILFCGMGSSLHAATLPAMLLADGGRRAWAEDASELLHYRRGLLHDVATVAISQSGESAETCRVVQERPAGTPAIAITNDPESPLARSADVVLPLLAGDELGTSSKTYISSLAVGLLLARTALDAAYPGPDQLSPVASILGDTMEAGRKQASDAMEWLGGSRSVRSLVSIGRGPSYATALQAALIIKEMTAIPAEGMSAGMFRHGPMELAAPGVPFLVLAPAGRTHELMYRLVKDLVSFGARPWVITDQRSTFRPSELGDRAFLTILPHVSEEFWPITSIIPVEFFAARLAEGLGLVPGELQRVTKVTSAE